MADSRMKAALSKPTSAADGERPESYVRELAGAKTEPVIGTLEAKATTSVRPAVPGGFQVPRPAGFTSKPTRRLDAATRTEASRAAAPKPAEALSAPSKPAEALSAPSRPAEALSAPSKSRLDDSGASGERAVEAREALAGGDADDPAISGIVHLREEVFETPSESQLESPLRPLGERVVDVALEPAITLPLGAPTITIPSNASSVPSGAPTITIPSGPSAVPLHFDDVTAVGRRRKRSRALTAFVGLTVGVLVGVLVFLSRGGPSPADDVLEPVVGGQRAGDEVLRAAAPLAENAAPFTNEPQRLADEPVPSDRTTEPVDSPAAEANPPPQLPSAERSSAERSSAEHSPEAEPAAIRFEDLPSEAPKAILNFNSIPVSKIRIDGKTIGETPKRGVSVPPGKRTIVFVHPTEGSRTRIIEVEPGQRRVVSVKF